MNCVHLDFHTGPDIPGIGEAFDREQFIKYIKDAKIDLMTVFAKCHHGYTYYPSELCEMHPGLKFNLLEKQIEAIHAAGAKAPIYITVGWCKKDADEHPQWRMIDFYTRKPLEKNIPTDENAPMPECTWEYLCPVGGYLEHLKALTHEVCQKFDVSDGVFYDICFMSDNCVCDDCKAGMIAMGLDPENIADARKYYSLKHVEMMKTLTGIVHSYKKDAPVFYNGGADMNRTEYHPYQTHYELEDLPTAWGGYDQMPIRAKFFEKYGKHFLGMTGKFHHAWGEFGGFKNKEALRYECADMLSVGASISVGDHLHPSGALDESTYDLIGHAFRYVNSIKDFCENTRAYTDLALFISHDGASDMGASKLLHTMHLEYDVIENCDKIDKYSCIILPEGVKTTEADRANLVEFTKRGGKVIACYDSIFDELGVKKIAPSKFDRDFIRYEMEDCKTPFLSYSSAYITESDGQVLAQVYEPYFSRTVSHFCGHKNTPNKTEPASYPAMVRLENLLYIAHPVFKSYNATGNYTIERYLISAIESIYDRAIVTENLPSCARVRLRRDNGGKFLALHLLYAPPVNRGFACVLPDFPTLHEVKISIKCDKEITDVTLQPEGVNLPFTRAGDRINFTLPPFNLHKLVVLK